LTENNIEREQQLKSVTNQNKISISTAGVGCLWTAVTDAGATDVIKI